MGCYDNGERTPPLDGRPGVLPERLMKNADSYLVGRKGPVPAILAYFYPDDPRGLKRWEDMVRRHLRPNSAVLDAGCGRGRDEFDLQGACAMSVGLDPSPEIQHNPWVRHRLRGDLHFLPFSDGSFDVVIASNVLEHLGQPGKVFAEVSRVLREGGKFIFVTPNKTHYSSLIARSTPLWFHRWANARIGIAEEDVFPKFYRANTRAKLQSLANSAQLKLEQWDLFECCPGNLAIVWPAFLLGCIYGWIIQRFRMLAGLRAQIRAVFVKAPGPQI